jgi:hypothetical protein
MGGLDLWMVLINFALFGLEVLLNRHVNRLTGTVHHPHSTLTEPPVATLCHVLHFQIRTKRQVFQ